MESSCYYKLCSWWWQRQEAEGRADQLKQGASRGKIIKPEGMDEGFSALLFITLVDSAKYQKTLFLSLPFWYRFSAHLAATSRYPPW